MIRKFGSTVAVFAILSGVGSHASAQTRSSFSTDAPAVPSTIEVPDGYAVFFRAHAAGAQDYMCLPAASGVAWKLVGPQATLYQTIGPITQQVATHFLSANPLESATPRPTWQQSFDSSRVWGRALRSSTDPTFVEAGAIPWLLLTVVGAEAGPSGGAFLTQTAYIQRVNTSGGAAPATGCALVTDVGALALVPYSADYLFYKASIQ